MSFFRRRVGDDAAAEDLTQDTIVKVLALSRDGTIDQPGALVFRIAANLVKDRYRMAGRRGAAQLHDLDLAAVSDVTREFIEEHDPERVLIAREQVATVASALGELNERTRAIYVLFRLENMKQKDIADIFGVSCSTVEKSILKATLHLMKRLGRASP